MRAFGGGAKVREVSCPLCVRRNVLKKGGRSLFPPPFLGEKEKRFLFIGIVVMRDINRPANRVPEIMLFVRRIRMIRIVSRFPAAGVEEIIAQVFKPTAMETACSAFPFYFASALT